MGETIDALIARRYSRRDVLGVALAGAALARAGVNPLRGALAADPAKTDSTLGFAELPHGMDGDLRVAYGYDVHAVVRWGDPLFADSPAFDPLNLTVAGQERQFGYNNDFVAFMPLPRGSKNSGHGLLCVNHEYTNARLMFSGLLTSAQLAFERVTGTFYESVFGPPYALTRDQVEIEMAAHGHSVVEIQLRDGIWKPVANSAYNRRLSMLSTPIRIAGPAAGHRRLQTAADPAGRTVTGTLNNCSGGVTPWGTVLIAEENINFYFAGDPKTTTEARNHKRLGIDPEKIRFQWARHVERFNVEKHPNEPNRFGWVVELDPYDPNATPVKRTALGRFKHEAATVTLAADGRVVVYSGDDERFEYVYRFVSADRYHPDDRLGHGALLDQGTLAVAKFEADGRLLWLPLVWGDGPLTPANGFESQADVLIETRRAADLVGATPMDRPEDVETNPLNGRVYVVLTNNDKRAPDRIDAANPRSDNKHGHILELSPPGGRGQTPDHAADEFRWDIFLLAGDPANAEQGVRYHPQVSQRGWLSCPDNIAFDGSGRIWIATDGAEASGFEDGIWAADVAGPGRALTRHFMTVPRGAEMCGPCFTPDDKTLFASVQHPGQEPGVAYTEPPTGVPDFDSDMPPRPAVVAVTRKQRRIGE